LGNYDKALLLNLEAKDIRKNIVGVNHSDYATSCNNLGDLYSEMGDYNKSKSFYIEAKEINNNIFGTQHSSYALNCSNLAQLYSKLGDFTIAEELEIAAKNVRETLFGKQHPDYALSCNNIAVLYTKMANYKEAELLFKEAMFIYEKVYGKLHPDYAMCCNNLASINHRNNKFNKAEALYIEVSNLINLYTQQSERFMSEKERDKYVNSKLNFHFDIYQSFFLTNGKAKEELGGIVYDNALNLKGQLLKSTTSLRKRVLSSGDTSLINDYNQLNAYGSYLAQQYALPIPQRQTNVIEVEEKINLLEKKLLRKSQNIRIPTNIDKNWKTVKESLKDNEAAIEFINFRYHNGTTWTDSIYYYALLLQNDYDFPKAIYLFEQKELEAVLKGEESDKELVGDLYSFRGFKPVKSTQAKQKKSKLDSLIWKAINKNLAGTETIYISPSGLLNKIAFDAIPYKDSLLLSDKYNIVYTSSTLSITNKDDLKFSEFNDIALFGGIKYSATEEELLSVNNRNEKQIGNEDLKNAKSKGNEWGYLEGTKVEIDNIANIFKNKARNIEYSKYSGLNATEEVFKALENNSPSILHISTHGFYFKNAKNNLSNNVSLNNKNQYQHSDNPLIRTGLLFAGGNRSWSGKPAYTNIGDGVLSAYEISHLNLHNTKLAVLSACQTGLGDVQGNEGVFGLQRAFKMAGVEYLIVSLWEVPDFETQEFMTLFYENLLIEENIEVAFSKTQKTMKTKYKNEPYKWAAFVLIR